MDLQYFGPDLELVPSTAIREEVSTMLQVCKATLLFANALMLCHAAETGVGRWEGAVQIPVIELKIVIDLARDGDWWIGSAVVPELNIKGAPLTDIAVMDGDVAFTIKGTLGESKFKRTLERQHAGGRLHASGKYSLVCTPQRGRATGGSAEAEHGHHETDGGR
jgi:hypothetical protein